MHPSMNNSLCMNNSLFTGPRDELFKKIENNTEENFFRERAKKIKMVNLRSKINQFIFHLSNPLTIFFRNIFLKKLVKNKKFLENYLGKIYR